MNKPVQYAIGLALAGLHLATAAQFTKPEDAVKYRQGAWSVLNHHFTRIGAMARGRLPFDASTALRDAELVALLARLPLDAFGSNARAPGDHARPEIWTEPVRFRENGERMVAASGQLLTAARTRNLDQIKAAFAAASNTCKECHDAYRSH